MKILVAGASGFLGGYLVERLIQEGHQVRAVSSRPLSRWTRRFADAQCLQGDLRDRETCFHVARGCERIYHMAAMIGGIGYLESRHADCTASVVVSSNLLEAAVRCEAGRLLFPSSACVYPESPGPLREEDVRACAPRGGYGWQKLFTEKMCGYYAQQYGLETRIARLGTVYGPHSPLGEAEKAPIAMCRKVIEAVRGGADTIEIWGDGEQTRSFLYVDDCIDALVRLMESSCPWAINVDGDERVSVNALVDVVEGVAGVKLKRRYREGPQGVRDRICDTTLARRALGWSPRTTLAAGIERTFEWVQSVTRERAVA